MRTLRLLHPFGLLCSLALVTPRAHAAEPSSTPVETPATAVTSGGSSTPEPEPVGYPACAGGPDADAMVAARGAFDAGNAAFNEADYPRALLYWEDAYRRDCTAHAMLKNLARAYELGGQLKHAIVAIEAYLQRVKDSGEEEALRNRISNLRAKLNEQERASSAAVIPKEVPEPGPPARRQPARKVNLKPAPRDASTAELPPDPVESSRSLWPLLPVGLGAATIGLSAVQWLGAKHDEDAAARLCPTRRNCSREAENAGNQAVDREITWSIVGAGGAAVLLAGVVWYVVQDPTSEQTLSAHVHPDFVGMDWSGRF